MVHRKKLALPGWEVLEVNSVAMPTLEREDLLPWAKEAFSQFAENSPHYIWADEVRSPLPGTEPLPLWYGRWNYFPMDHANI